MIATTRTGKSDSGNLHFSINKGIVHVETYIRHLHGGNDHRPILGGETVLVGSFIGCRYESVVFLQIVYYQTAVGDKFRIND